MNFMNLLNLLRSLLIPTGIFSASVFSGNSHSLRYTTYSPVPASPRMLCRCADVPSKPADFLGCAAGWR